MTTNMDSAMHSDSAVRSTAAHSHTHSIVARVRRLCDTRCHSAIMPCVLASMIASWPANAFAYRTAADLREFDDLAAAPGEVPIVAWANPNVTFRLNTSTSSTLNVEDVARAFNTASNTWNTPICSALNVGLSGTTTQSAQPGDSTNTVQFVDDWSALGFSPKVGAVTDVQYEERPATAENTVPGWVIAEVDIYLDAENYEWAYEVSNPEDQRKSLLSVLTHELGHAAGLLHPCETEDTRDTAGASADPNAPLCTDVPGAAETLLYPEYSPTQSELSADERAAVCFLYAKESCETLGCATGELCTDQGCLPACGDEVCAADEQCFQNECVPLCSGLDCYLGQECSKTSDCPNFLKCRNAPIDDSTDDSDADAPSKVCQPGSAPLGDFCDSSRDCASSACSKDGFCVPACETDADCTDGITCEKTLGSFKGCVGDGLAGMGQACDEANECLGNQCVSGRSATPVCTRECSVDPEADDSLTCPDGFECGAAVTDGVERTVCLPPAEATSCSISTPASIGASKLGSARASSRAFSLFGATCALSLIVHFARRRRPRANVT